MAEFPGSIPTFTNLNPNATLAANNHANRHNKVHEEVAAIATRVGTDGSVDPVSHEFRLNELDDEVAALQAGSTNSVYSNVTPSGTINGSNVFFTVPHTFIANSLDVYRNGVRLKGGGDDYTETPGGFTMVTPPLTGARLLVDYMTSHGISNNADTVDGMHAADIILAVKQALHPVGSIYTNAVDATNPGTLLGFGTWVAFGQGRVAVGIDGSQTEFDTAGETGGEKAHVDTVAEMPVHTHQWRWRVNFPKTTGLFGTNDVGGDAVLVSDNAPGGNTAVGYDWSGGTDGNLPAGSGAAHNNLQPYVVVYMWRRTA